MMSAMLHYFGRTKCLPNPRDTVVGYLRRISRYYTIFLICYQSRFAIYFGLSFSFGMFSQWCIDLYNNIFFDTGLHGTPLSNILDSDSMLQIKEINLVRMIGWLGVGSPETLVTPCVSHQYVMHSPPMTSWKSCTGFEHKLFVMSTLSSQESLHRDTATQNYISVVKESASNLPASVWSIILFL